MQRRFVLYVRCTPLSTRPEIARILPDSWVSAGLRLAPPVLGDLHAAGGLSYTSSEQGALPRPQEPNFLGPSPAAVRVTGRNQSLEKAPFPELETPGRPNPNVHQGSGERKATQDRVGAGGR